MPRGGRQRRAMPRGAIFDVLGASSGRPPAAGAPTFRQPWATPEQRELFLGSGKAGACQRGRG